MPVARSLLDYLSLPTCALPRRHGSARAVREILHILAQPERDGGRLTASISAIRWARRSMRSGWTAI
jgi:hypothetical protein